jgi:hypothetical protein
VVFCSANPHWEAAFTAFPEHPATRGVKPFSLRDEWYYNMRFRDSRTGLVPLLTATPPAETLSRPDGPHSGNPDVRAICSATGSCDCRRKLAVRNTTSAVSLAFGRGATVVGGRGGPRAG